MFNWGLTYRFRGLVCDPWDGKHAGAVAVSSHFICELKAEIERLGLVWALETSATQLLQGRIPNPSQTVRPTGIENIKIHELMGVILIRTSTGPELC